ncbi:tetratricopeptide repeat protein [Herpetosiphon giganteus]|uniref:tetratricopeptide repeat protein n=1 Tax=Herpetosiphon giganteus TaxID=2029754 RepID=UPI001958F357|nr:adenylate/guanylate cyclase domain-containing protein [Herpetosiphon giganteus]MBM7841798.1 class 3 adenylate cyclase [Herpetosiphon giganteus]
MSISPSSSEFASLLRQVQQAEVSLTQPQLDALYHQLDQRIQQLQRYVPDPIVQRLKQGSLTIPYGEHWTGSLLFADLSGFTALSESLTRLGKEGAEQVTSIINRLFDQLVADIEAHGGALIKFGGDAVTAFFDQTKLGVQHALFAAHAAQAMQTSMASLGKIQIRAGQFNLTLRIGVHSGEAFAALLGDQQHAELMLTGIAVNLVARAQELARPGEVVCSKDTMRLLGLPADPNTPFTALTTTLEHPPYQAESNVTAIAQPVTLERVQALATIYHGLKGLLPQRMSEEQLLSNAASKSGEIRLVTIVFAHIAPFSTIVELCDAASATLLLNHYYQRMQQIVNHYGGVVNKLDMAADGDKLLAIFGAPVANENDTELAVRAGLDMQSAMNEINALIQQHDLRLPLLDQQIGINQGHVFAGIVGSETRREYTVMGDPVNTAVRLMSVCRYGEVLASPAVKRLTSHAFAYESLPALALKGKSEPIEPARVDRAYNVRRETMRADLVGRVQELDQLAAISIQALQGQGQIINIFGEAGIGKSRLLEELLSRLSLASFDPNLNVPEFMPITIECQLYEQTTPFASASEMLRQVLRLNSSLTSERLIQIISQRVSKLAPELERFLPLLSDILHVSLAENELTQALAPEQRHDQTIELVVALIVASANATPLVILWDDVHWIDASSRQLLERLTKHAEQAPIALLVGSRTKGLSAMNWPEQTITLELSELSMPESEALASAIIGNAPLPAALLERWRRSDERFFNPQGNPFFIEEMMRSLIQQGVIVETSDGWDLRGELDSLPTTIEGVITARLDRLDTRIRETVQVASVVGRRFELTILRGITNDDDLVNQMDRLTNADVVLPDHIAADLAYLFKHTLTRDVAYEGILYARRRELHRRVAARIQEVYRQNLLDVLPILARHYARAEDWHEAVRYYREAGITAQKRYFNAEACAHYRDALELLPNLGKPEHSLAQELTERLGYVLLQAGDYAEALPILAQAQTQLRQSSVYSHSREARILRHITTIYERQGEYELAFEQLQQALALLGEQQSVERVRALLLGSGLHQRQGRYHETIAWAEQALALAEELGLQAEQARAYLLMGSAHRVLGDRPLAIRLLTQSIELYEQTSEISRLADAYNNTATAYSDIGQWEPSIQLYLKAYQIKDSINDRYGQALVSLNLGELYRKTGQFEQALNTFEQSLKLWNKLKSFLGAAITTMNIGNTCLAQANFHAAESYLDQSRAIFDEINVSSFLSELYRIYAELFYRQAAYSRALDYCEFSLSQAQQRSAKADEGLAELWRSRVLQQLQQPTLALEAGQQALTILSQCTNKEDIRSCLEHLIAMTSDSNLTLAAHYQAQLATIIQPKLAD